MSGAAQLNQQNAPPPVGGSLFLTVRVVTFDPRSGTGAVVREDTGERFEFYGFYSDQCSVALMPGERVWGELVQGEVVNLIRLN